MPKPASFRCKIPDWNGIHGGFWLTLRPGYTAIVGPNGAGKTTLLRQLKGIAGERGFLVLDYSNLESGAKASRNAWLQGGDIKRAATSLVSSEGENITIAFGPVVTRIGQLVSESIETDKPLMILLDALDSGASIDRLRDLLDLFDLILKDAGVLDGSHPSRGIYIVAAVNSYELASHGICADPRTGETMTFASYPDYAKFICDYDLEPRQAGHADARP